MRADHAGGRAAGGLAHPSIITVHDVLDEDGRPWIVMDLVEGPSLEHLLVGGGPLPPQRVARTGLQLLDALTFAHERVVLHRDVQPANVLLAGEDRAILTDFGIAVRSGDTALTSAEVLVGSPGYMARERVRHDRAAGPPSDLWSLGATLYAAVEGRGPFHRENRLAVLGAVLTAPTPPPTRAGPLGAILLAVLEKEPERRPDAAALRQALRAVAYPEQAHAMDSPGMERGGTPYSPATPRTEPPRTGTAPEMPRPPGRDGTETADIPVQVAMPRGWRLGVAAAAAGAGAMAAALVTANALTGTGPWTTETPATTRTTAAATYRPQNTSTFRPQNTSTLAASPTAAAAPDPCTLLTEAQAKALSGGRSRPENHTTCVWQGSANIEVKVNAYADERTAKETLALQRAAAVAATGTGKDLATVAITSAVRNVPGLGNEAFAQDTGTKSDFEASASTTVWLRVAPSSRESPTPYGTNRR